MSALGVSVELLELTVMLRGCRVILWILGLPCSRDNKLSRQRLEE